MSKQQITVEAARWDFGTRVRDHFLDWWADHPLIDLVLTVLLVGGHWIVVREFHHGDILVWSGMAGQTASFAAGAGAMSLIAGFAAIAITQYGSSSGEIVNLLRRTHGNTIRRNWLNITSWLLVSAVLCIVALAIDTHPRSLARWVFEFAFVIAILKFARLTVLFRLILVASDQDSVTTSKPPIRMVER